MDNLLFLYGIEAKVWSVLSLSTHREGMDDTLMTEEETGDTFIVGTV